MGGNSECEVVEFIMRVPCDGKKNVTSHAVCERYHLAEYICRQKESENIYS